MRLLKRIFFWIFLTAALGAGAWAYLQLKNNKKPKVDALSVLPEGCVFYLRTNDFFEFNKKVNAQSLIVDKLKLFTDIGTFFNTLNSFDSLCTSQPFLKRELSGKVLHFGLYGQNLDWLLCFNLHQFGEQEKINESVVKTLAAKQLKNELFQFNFAGAGYFFTLKEGVVMVSNAEQTLLNAIDKTIKKFATGKEYLAFKNTLEENSLLSVYIDHHLFAQSVAAKRLLLPSICMGGISGAQADIKPSELKINGFFKPDSLSLISVLQKQIAQRPDFLNDLPFATHYFEAFNFFSYPQLINVLPKSKNGVSEQFWQAVNDSALYNLQNEFYDNLKQHLIDFKSGSSDLPFVTIKVSDTLLAKQHLKLMSDSTIFENIEAVYKLRFSNNTTCSLFAPFSLCSSAYVALFGDHLYFSEKSENLFQLVYQLKNTLLLSENKSFMAYKNQNFPEKYNYLIYTSPAWDKSRARSVFKFETKSLKDPFENFRHYSFSINHLNGQTKFRWQLTNETESPGNEQNILWALALDTTASSQAQSFVNHITHENELLIQDDAQKLYLINAKGTVLWKKPLTEKINSQMFMVDVFKNNKYQILFSSKNLLHLIDRNGNYLPGYPAKLPAEASAPLAVFDYEQNKDYRLLIPCKNKQIYNFAITGKKQDRFSIVKTDNLVRLPIQYVKVGASDYLIALDDDGRIYTFSRRGELRIGLKNKATANCAAFYIDATNNINSSFFVYADDKNGMINKISLADKKSIIKLNNDVENAGITFVRELNQNKTNIVFTKLNAVIVYDLNGNLLLNKKLENDLSETEFYTDESSKLFLTRSDIKGDLIVVDQLRDQIKQLKASALPLVSDLFNDHKKYLLVSDGARLSCLLLD